LANENNAILLAYKLCIGTSLFLAAAVRMWLIAITKNTKLNNSCCCTKANKDRNKNNIGYSGRNFNSQMELLHEQSVGFSADLNQ